MPRLSLAELTDLAARALKRAGASKSMATVTAQALVVAEAEGLSGHGLSRVALYAQHLRAGRADGKARPKIIRKSGATCLIDAGGGLAFPAAALATGEVIKRARRHGIAFAGVTNSHHFGAAAYHLAPVAEAGMVGIALTNSPAAINAWGGRKAFFGTNPVAAIFPRKNAAPIVIDLSLTEVTRGKIMLMAKEGKPIPPGWAVDRDGNPTTSAQAALTGSLSAIGGVKGTDSYFEPGNKPRIGHAMIVIDPQALAGADAYYARIEDMIRHMLADAGVRLPGARRQQAVARAQSAGIAIAEALHQELLKLGGCGGRS